MERAFVTSPDRWLAVWVGLVLAFGFAAALGVVIAQAESPYAVSCPRGGGSADPPASTIARPESTTATSTYWEAGGYGLLSATTAFATC